MLDGGDRACAIEVSSHALELGRGDAIPFAAALFTNLTQDHLDFHPTMEDYFLAKRRLFVPDDGPPPRVSVRQRRRPLRSRGSRPRCPMPSRSRSRARPTTPRGTCAAASAAARFTLESPAGAREVSCRCPAASTSPTRSARSPSRTGSACRWTRSSAALERGVRGARPLRARRARARTSRCSSTTRTRPTRSRTCWRPRGSCSTAPPEMACPPARTRPPAASCACSAPAATATAASAR